MKVIEQLCIKSFKVVAKNGDYFKAEQGKFYTTSIPNDKNAVYLFSNYWVSVPKDHFVKRDR